MTPAELKQYAHILLDEVLAQLPPEQVLSALEKHFTGEQLEYHKVTAIGCVRIREDMDERMRKYRAGTTRAAGL